MEVDGLVLKCADVKLLYYKFLKKVCDGRYFNQLRFFDALTLYLLINIWNSLYLIVSLYIEVGMA
nr:hypothetical protein KUHPSE09_03610 [Staphylococcus epidermidis]